MGNYIFPQDLLDDINQNIFTSIRGELMPRLVDDHPYRNFVKVDFDWFGKDGSQYEAAVREYVRIRERIKAEQEKIEKYGRKTFDKEILDKMRAWGELEGFTHFMLSEEEYEVLEPWLTPELSKLCCDTSVHYSVLKDTEDVIFHDLATNEFLEIYYSEPSYMGESADDAGFYSCYKLNFLGRLK